MSHATSAIGDEARAALSGLGWKPAIARAAAAAALGELNEDAPLPQVIREALRRCPRPGVRT